MTTTNTGSKLLTENRINRNKQKDFSKVYERNSVQADYAK